MADDESRYSIDELHLLRVPDGRCPHCGRPAEASEKKVFEDLRAATAKANGERDEAQSQQGELEEELNLTKAKWLEADERLKILRQRIAGEGE